MIYKNNDIPTEYNKLAEISDNYLVWVRESSLSSGVSYNAYVQLLQPSFGLFFTNDYKISNGTDYTLDANYVTSGMYNYLDSYDVSYTRSTLAIDSDYLSDNDYDRADMPLIFVCQFIVCLFVVWVLNQLSKLVHKGGVFGA